MTTAAIIGGGVIGGGWAARFLLNGWDVRVFDPDPQAERKIGEVLANARRALPSLYDKALPPEGKLSFHADMAEAVSDAVWIQESVPERLDLKHKIHKLIQQHAPRDAILGSSTSGFKPSELQEGALNPGQIIVAHPFNPVYLLPLVELVPSAATPDAVTQRASALLTSVGMKPLVVRKEIDAHIADRLLEAVWREGLWLIKDGICTTEELDDAIRFGFGLRWAQMGLFETYRIAGGEAGMKHFMAQFGPALEWPWTKLMDVPEFTDELVDLIASQSDAQSGHMSIRDLERLRDDNLVGMMRALKKSGSGAGGTINSHEAMLPDPEPADLPVTVSRRIPQSWTDYNGHMNEAKYLEAAAQATDRFMEMIGCDAEYIASGGSYFTVESHVRFLNEMHEGDALTITTQVLKGEGKKMHLFHRLLGSDGKLAATVETLLLHMDMKARVSALPSDEVAARLTAYATAHAGMPLPEGAGRHVGQKV
ncbi:carnitine 3-dehydrogenase [Paracoccus seriniphilus]|uniref:L-carnitine dehydrogenase n=1 Tax=Paracoccus seriniphilus TaxID=184748 RepID=A0A239PV83_9RHOB|nr:carnitine 3-dehydrogenase [Paracoccus seriniphilus]WCR15363.1 carnitine 3-dehydrogenase [Paracoccus seriniphilus]SNT73842.1 carnitine 3-dehydrogenase [Paracoccus seriniphilus]